MKTIEIFDPAMCCSSGVCGPSVDPEILRASRDVSWLGAQGVNVQRYNLAQEPARFVENRVVAALIAERIDHLPVTLLNGDVVGRGRYLTRAEYCEHLGLPAPNEVVSLSLKASP